MLVIKIEKWPFGQEEKAEEIGRTYVTNDGSGTLKRGNYDVEVCRRGTTEKPSGGGTAARTGRVEDYPRQSYNVWRLIIRALKSAFPEES